MKHSRVCDEFELSYDFVEVQELYVIYCNTFNIDIGLHKFETKHRFNRKQFKYFVVSMQMFCINENTYTHLSKIGGMFFNHLLPCAEMVNKTIPNRQKSPPKFKKFRFESYFNI